MRSLSILPCLLAIILSSSCTAAPGLTGKFPERIDVKIQPFPQAEEGWVGKEALLVELRIVYPDRTHPLPGFWAQAGKWTSAQAVVVIEPEGHWEMARHTGFGVSALALYGGPLWNCHEGTEVALRCEADGPDKYRLDLGVAFRDNYGADLQRSQVEGLRIGRAKWESVLLPRVMRREKK